VTLAARLVSGEEEVLMAMDIHAPELKLIRQADGVDMDLLPLQGL
jgi:hypothetical protein